MQGLKPKVYEFETKRYDMKGNTLSSLISVQHNITVILFFLRKYSHQHAFSSTKINKKKTPTGILTYFQQVPTPRLFATTRLSESSEELSNQIMVIKGST